METRQKIKTAVQNEMEISFAALSVNESFARVAVAAFISPLNPTVEELSDVKTAVSEAVTNAIIHGYDPEYLQEIGDTEKKNVYMRCRILGDVLEVEIRDNGKGIRDVQQAMEPLFTTKPEMDRSGMGFSFMEAFMDDLQVYSGPEKGTVVHMKKKLGTTPWIGEEE